MPRGKSRAKAVELVQTTTAESDPVTAVIGTTCAVQRPVLVEGRQVQATGPSLDELLSRIQPDLREIVVGTPLAANVMQLRQLATFAASEQSQIVRQVGIGIDWDAAVERFLPAPPPRPPIAGELGSVVEVELDRLTPNTVNGAIFSESLTDKGVAPIIEDLERRGMRVPVEVVRTGIILDGERRFRAARRRGEKTIRVRIVADDMSDEEIRAYIFDAHSTSRDASLHERLNLFKLGVEILRQRHGIPTGKHVVSSNEETMTGAEIRELAAKRAGLGSAEKARRALKVVEIGDDKVRTGMLAGKLSINGAYARLGLPAIISEMEGAEPKPANLDTDASAVPLLVAPTMANDSPAREVDDRSPSDVASRSELPGGNVCENPFDPIRRSETLLPPASGARLMELEDEEQEDAAHDVPVSGGRPADEQEPVRTNEEPGKPCVSSDAGSDELPAPERSRPSPSAKVGIRQRPAEETNELSSRPNVAKQRATDLTLAAALDRLYDHINRLMMNDRQAARNFAVGVMKKLKELITPPA